MSDRGICHIWFRGRPISPSMPYREARSVAESSEGPTASKSDRTGRNPGMTRLVRRSSAGVWRYCVFSLVQTFRQRMRKCSGSSIPSLPKKINVLFFFFFFFFFVPAIFVSPVFDCSNHYHSKSFLFRGILRTVYLRCKKKSIIVIYDIPERLVN